MAAFVDALPLNLRLRKGGIPYPRLKMNINSSDLCSRVTRYWALSNRISDMGWCTFNYQTRIWDSYPWGCYFSNIPTWQMSPSFRFAKILHQSAPFPGYWNKKTSISFFVTMTSWIHGEWIICSVANSPSCRIDTNNVSL